MAGLDKSFRGTIGRDITLLYLAILDSLLHLTYLYPTKWQALGWLLRLPILKRLTCRSSFFSEHVLIQGAKGLKDVKKLAAAGSLVILTQGLGRN